MVPEWPAETELNKPPSFGSDLDVLAADYCFGEIWTREDLDRKSRSLATVSMLIGSGRFEELRFHFPAAVRNGWSVKEIDEVILHATAYVGFPAATSARRIARESLGKAGLL